MVGVKESEKKDIKVAGIVKFLGLPVANEPKKQPLKKVKVVNLRELAAKAVLKYTKEELNVIIAEYKWPYEYDVWKDPID
ncbi:hypothetical protein DPMN_118270 [Dreissena polymorpha]|uniref:Uncharacterized protein n=1 Tax=Dreissena polymorpha TaxID=45954 RepID=A0A9D4GJV7_DREPO|nr:hypothetical protein DPMN_118270 [Dreissena polymorpha]